MSHVGRFAVGSVWRALTVVRESQVIAGRQAHPCRERRAFTLVEVLVVIGIIGVLLSILMPVLSKVRQQAYAAKCASNLHTLGQAWQMYVNANRGTCPPGR